MRCVVVDVARVGGSCSMVRIIQAGLSGQAERMCVPPDEEDIEVIQSSEGDEEQALGVIALESMIRQRE